MTCITPVNKYPFSKLEKLKSMEKYLLRNIVAQEQRIDGPFTFGLADDFLELILSTDQIKLLHTIVCEWIEQND